MDYLYLFGGLIVLLLSGDFLVRGGVSLAGHFKVSTLVVGLTVVSLGTSAPELMVSLKAVLNGQSDISTGTVIGSNISNIALVLGLTALVLPISVNKRTTLFDWPIMFGATLIFFVFILNKSLDRIEGLLFVLLLAAYVIYSLWNSRKQEQSKTDTVVKPKYKLWQSILIIVVSGVGLRYGADWLVVGAAGIATGFGISEYLISVSIVAFGTSVPELATSLIAAFKKEMDISVGNIIGSNIFNIWGILGITAAIKPISVNQQILDFDMYWLIGICVVLLLFMLPVKRGKILRWNGAILVASYAFYLIKIFTDKV
jgi:cation:H+ antiporter